jgi:hypothetical protein
LWSDGVKFSEIHRRILAQYGEKCIMQRKVYEWVDRFQSGRTRLLMKTAWAIHPYHKQQTLLNKMMLWFERTDRLLSLIQPTIWASAVDLYIPSSMRIPDFTKFVQVVYQSSLQMSTNGHAIFVAMDNQGSRV